MDKTIVNGTFRKCESDKYTESFLCDEIYANMKMLAFFYPFSDELKACFSNGMFIKSNPQAFPHVMRYLFIICEPNEFKKKFGWPLYNKAAEATFRNSTLELLTKLNCKYGLGFGELKNKIVVFPGGPDFMRIIYELTKLMMRLILKRNNATDNGGQRIMTLQEAKQKLQKMQNIHERAISFCVKLEQHKIDVKIKKQTLTEIIKKLLNGSTVQLSHILDGSFISKWKQIQQNYSDKSLKTDMLRMKSFKDNTEMLDSRIARILETQTINYDIDDFNKFMVHMQKLQPTHYEDINKIVKNHQINLDKLFLTFDLALPLILSSVASFKPKSVDVLKFEIDGIEKLALTTNAMFHKVNVYDRKLINYARTDQDVFAEKMCNTTEQAATRNSHIKSLILATPPISYNAIKRTENAAQRAKRISMMEDHIVNVNKQTGQTGKSLGTISEHLALMTPARVRSSNIHNTSLSPLRTGSKNKLDPLVMLRTIEKKDKFRQPLGLKAKAQLKKNKQKPNETMPNIIVTIPNFSSTIINTSKDKCEQSVLSNLQSTISSPLRDITEQLNSTPSLTGRQSLLQHFASFEKSESDLDVKRSPSGRIEGRFSVEFESTVIFSSNVKTRASESMKALRTSPCISRIQVVNNDVEVSNTKASKENDSSLKNIFNLLAESSGESLLNVSDSVLKTINENDYYGND